MGSLNVPCRVADLSDHRRSVALPELLVDAGSTHTWIHRSILEGVGIAEERKPRTFTTADGRTLDRPIAYAVLHVGDDQTVDEVVVAEPGDPQRLGARTLDRLRLRVDPIRNLLVPVDPAPAPPA